LRILVIKGLSQYGGTRLFADEAAAAFHRRGDVAEIFDLGVGETPHADFAAAAARRFDLVLSFNIMGDFRSPAGATMAELFGCPHVVWHTDYILASWDRLRGTPPSTPLLVVDPTQVDALAAAGPDRHRARFFPHPAVGTPIPDELDAEAFAAGRPIPVLWSGGYVPPQRPWSAASPGTQKIMDTAVDLALSVEWMPPHLALAQVLKAVGYDLSDPAGRQRLAGAWLIDAEVRTTRRQAFLHALADSGAPLHICGEGWEPHLHRFSNATWHGPVAMTRMVELMRQSRVVLNTNGNFGAGSHERPFSAALAGAATFSDHSLYYAAEFQPGVDIELFSWLDLAGAMDRLSALSTDPERCWTMARSAKALTLARHTWDRQVPDILAAAGLPTEPVAPQGAPG
jgi:hypothetical protein